MQLQNTHVAVAFHFVCHLSFNMTDPLDGELPMCGDINNVSQFRILEEIVSDRGACDWFSCAAFQ